MGDDFGVWDKSVASKLREMGLDQSQIGQVIGIISEQRQSSYMRGYAKALNESGSVKNVPN